MFADRETGTGKQRFDLMQSQINELNFLKSIDQKREMATLKLGSKDILIANMAKECVSIQPQKTTSILTPWLRNSFND